MVGETWSSTSKICDACKTSPAAVFCRTDSSFLCTTCDTNIHAANKLASRHARVFLCEVCEQAPASVTCKADAAALCAACDRDIHSVNPLAGRHERLPVTPFYNAASAMISSPSTAIIGDEFSEEEAEAASWLLNDPSSKVDDESGSPEYKSSEYLFHDLNPCLDLDLISYEQKLKNIGVINEKEQYHCSDGVVPVHQCKNEFDSGQIPGPVVDGFPTCEVNYPGSKPFVYNFTSQSIGQNVSSSSLDAGLVPDHNPMADAINTFATNETIPANPASGLDREARVLRYREKRKNRKFEKTIRYASRKAYAETRPRIKGRFAKRSELELDSSYFVVPTF
ncbi:zinc finger protein CONSTANS-LIKE 3-like [Primulina eburnea]|uniref:zinc finger protein CONSTANS-LIKE 3-like n=1 Tax=Primulina eburnea TaxID=1245227 RepID=UPI003C6BE185